MSEYRLLDEDGDVIEVRLSSDNDEVYIRVIEGGDEAAVMLTPQQAARLGSALSLLAVAAKVHADLPGAVEGEA